MVGTRRTNACATCRQRRVKCDEVRPICGQCSKKNRPCKESLPPGFIWIKSGKRGETSPPTPTSQVDFTSSHEPLSLVKVLEVGQGATVRKYRSATHLSLRKQNGAFASGVSRSGVIPRSPEMLHLDWMQLSFGAAYGSGPEGFRLSCLGLQWADVPRYLGTSAAMDDAVSCIIWTHQSFVRNASEKHTKGPSLHFKSYNKALMSLQKALDNPEEGKQSTTLCAIAMLANSEILGRAGTNHNYVMHAGGVAAFMRSAGPACVQDDLGKISFTMSIGSVIVNAFITGKKCFLTEPDWAFSQSNRHSVDCVKTIKNQLLINFSHLPTLLVDIRTAHKHGDSLEALKMVLDQALRLRDDICDIHTEIDSLLRCDDPDSCVVTRRVSTCEDSPFPLATFFSNQDTAHYVLHSWGMMLQINAIVDTLNDSLVAAGASTFSEEFIVEKRRSSKCYTENICSSIEYAKQFSPLGATFMAYPVCVAWGQAPAEWKDWMLQELNTITGPMTHCYTAPILDWAYGIFTR